MVSHFSPENYETIIVTPDIHYPPEPRAPEVCNHKHTIYLHNGLPKVKCLQDGEVEEEEEVPHPKEGNQTSEDQKSTEVVETIIENCTPARGRGGEDVEPPPPPGC